MADGGARAIKDLGLLNRLGVKPRRVPPIGSGRMYDLGPGFVGAVSVLLDHHLATRLHFAERAPVRKFPQFGPRVRVEIADPRVQALEQRVAKLERALEQRALWRVGELKRRVGLLATSAGIAPENVLATENLLSRLHDVVRGSGLDCMPEPQLDHEPDDNTVELTWFDRANSRTLSVVAVHRVGDSAETWNVRLHQFSGGVSEDILEPTNAQLSEALRNFIGA